MGEAAEGVRPAPDGPAKASPPQHRGGVVDDHGRAPGAASRVGTGSTAPPSDPERVANANANAENLGGDLGGAPRPAAHPVVNDPAGGIRRAFELVFPDGGEGGPDTVEVTVTGRTGPGGHPVYEDATGIIQAEISDRSEVRVLATGAGQEPPHGVTARPLR
ncbi:MULTISPECIES: DUF6296 family protein [unclassified Streptomyces]|uniref:DUF6296 family protein n=1 Tax=unclassified Streptomyces TaxID=2593676 RepID=UPI00269DCCD8